MKTFAVCLASGRLVQLSCKIQLHSCVLTLFSLSFSLSLPPSSQTVDKKGPARDAGLRPDHLVTHINGESITGLQHVQVMHLMIDKKNSVIVVSTIPLEQTSIRKDSRKRAPSLGHRVGKLFRHRSSGSGKIKKRPSFFSKFRKDKGRSHIDSPGHSSSGTPSPKLPSSPHRSESFKASMSRLQKIIKPDRRRKHTPVSPLARSTSPVALTHGTPNSSPTGSMQNLNNATPPSSPPNPPRRPERHSMFVDSQLLYHKKSLSAHELTPPLPIQPKKSVSSPQTSPLLRRAMSPSEKKGSKPRRAETLPRTVKHKHRVHMVKIAPQHHEDIVEDTTNL